MNSTHLITDINENGTRDTISILISQIPWPFSCLIKFSFRVYLIDKSSHFMNQARRSAVRNMPLDSVDYTLVENLCTQAPDGNATNPKSGTWLEFKKLLMKVSGFWFSQSQTYFHHNFVDVANVFDANRF